jgi:hypothetical protein
MYHTLNEGKPYDREAEYTQNLQEPVRAVGRLSQDTTENQLQESTALVVLGKAICVYLPKERRLYWRHCCPLRVSSWYHHFEHKSPLTCRLQQYRWLQWPSNRSFAKR